MEVTTPEQSAPVTDRPIIIEPALIPRTLWLIRRAFIAALEDNCYGIAKGAAYSGLLSSFPVLTTMAAILLQIRAESIARLLSEFLRQVVPPGAEELVLSRFRDQGQRPILLLVTAICVSLWAASGAMASLMEGFQAAYRIPTGRSFIRQRAMAIFLVLIVSVPSVVASTLILLGSRTEAILVHVVGISKNDVEVRTPIIILGHVVRYAIGFGTTVFLTGLLYYFGPNHRPVELHTFTKRPSRFMMVWPGALLATTLWLLATLLFGWYVRRVANYNFFYGSTQTVIALLIWMYLLSAIALVGCEYNAERERLYSLLSRY
jgi:membrane protein